MPHDYLGIGWNFPVAARSVRDSGTDLSAEEAHYEESVRQSIWIVLSTARGERVMRPDFGCGIHNLMFGLDNSSTIGLVQHEVEQALLFWEPRIEVLAVEVSAERGGESSRPFLQIEYARFREAESRKRFYALPHAERESLRRSVLEQGVRASGSPAPSMPPTGFDDRLLADVAKNLPSFESWHNERKAHTPGPALLITIDYIVKATNSRFNVVYPFYLERRPGGHA